ncbi:glycosyl-4,4'-diaponeurosporenoate acyltransferase CrtO family protein [Spirosoma flavum]|uniref:Glycosyl-4,4'-diaponeurosporenoate acyltransferase n=1 Tax=Spirosoma flavum TaxID=2048557 RepID=A0ABW6ALR2_9BACT
MDPTWLYAFLSISFLPFLVPNGLFDRIQPSSSAGFYTRLGIRTIRKYTQDGDLINQWLKRKFPGYSPTKRGSLQQHVGKSYINEKFHVGCFLFFLLSSLYAFHQGCWGWVAIILISNLMYNVYPILLQQYNRIRLTQLIQRRLSTKRE